VILDSADRARLELWPLLVLILFRSSLLQLVTDPDPDVLPRTDRDRLSPHSCTAEAVAMIFYLSVYR